MVLSVFPDKHQALLGLLSSTLQIAVAKKEEKQSEQGEIDSEHGADADDFVPITDLGKTKLTVHSVFSSLEITEMDIVEAIQKGLSDSLDIKDVPAMVWQKWVAATADTDLKASKRVLWQHYDAPFE